MIRLTHAAWVFEPMGSRTFDGVRFVVYSNDHPPRHVHGFVSEAEAVVDLRADGNVALSDRMDAVRPPNAKRPDVRRILNCAAVHFEERVALWEGIHGGTQGNHNGRGDRSGDPDGSAPGG
jgi:hypothetical protein